MTTGRGIVGVDVDMMPHTICRRAVMLAWRVDIASSPTVNAITRICATGGIGRWFATGAHWCLPQLLGVSFSFAGIGRIAWPGIL